VRAHARALSPSLSLSHSLSQKHNLFDYKKEMNRGALLLPACAALSLSFSLSRSLTRTLMHSLSLSLDRAYTQTRTIYSIKKVKTIAEQVCPPCLSLSLPLVLYDTCTHSRNLFYSLSLRHAHTYTTCWIREIKRGAAPACAASAVLLECSCIKFASACDPYIDTSTTPV